MEQLQALMGSFGGQFVTCLTCPHNHLFGGQSWPGWSGSLRLMIWSWKMAPCYGDLLHLRPKDDFGLDHDLRIFRTPVCVGKIEQIPLDLAGSQEPASTLSEGRRPESTYTRAEGPSDRDAQASQN